MEQTTPQTNNPAKGPQLVVDQLFQGFSNFATRVFDDFAEPVAIGFVVHWAHGNIELPAGIMFTRDNKFQQPALLALAEQSAKFIQQLMAVAGKNINDARVASERMTAILLQRQEQIKIAEARLTELIKETQGGRPNPAATGDQSGGSAIYPPGTK